MSFKFQIIFPVLYLQLLGFNLSDQDIDEEYFEGTENIIPENNWLISGHVPKMVSQGAYYKVEPGSTVKMECQFTDLSDEFRPTLSWRKLDRQNTLISKGGQILNHSYNKKATVSIGTTGSVLLLAPVEHVDAGLYQCSLLVGKTVEKVVHTVEVIIAPELESRNWHHSLNTGLDNQFNSLALIFQMLVHLN